jgi:hypothetical protein
MLASGMHKARMALSKGCSMQSLLVRNGQGRQRLVGERRLAGHGAVGRCLAVLALLHHAGC